MRDMPHYDDPEQDLDMAGFGLVKVSADDTRRWTPKQAYHEVAHRYAATAQRPQA